MIDKCFNCICVKKLTALNVLIIVKFGETQIIRQ